ERLGVELLDDCAELLHVFEELWRGGRKFCHCASLEIERFGRGEDGKHGATIAKPAGTRDLASPAPACTLPRHRPGPAHAGKRQPERACAQSPRMGAVLRVALS